MVGELKESVVLALVVASLCASGADYYWKGVHYVNKDFDPGKGYGKWSNLSNWSTDSESGADAPALPGASDKIYGLVENTWRQFDLENGEWTISGWYSTGDWKRHNWRFTNGTLHWAGQYNTHSDTVYLDAGASFVFDAGSRYTASYGHASSDYWYVHSGASLTILGHLSAYNVGVTVYEGGSMDFRPSRLDLNKDTTKTCWIENYGNFSAANGFSFSEGARKGKFEFRQLAGTLTLGGPVTKNGKAGTYNMVVGGGTVRITGDVFVDFTSATVTNNITLRMDEGSSLDLFGISFDPGVVVAKTGAGDLAFQVGRMPGALNVAEGGLLLDVANASYDLSAVTFSPGGKVKIGASGVALEAWDASISAATFETAHGFCPASGSTVFTCADAAILETARVGLNATLPEGFSVAASGDSLVATAAYVFNSTTVTDLNDPAGWLGGEIPSNGIATVAGEGVAPVVSGTIPAFSEIVVQSGASLALSADAALPSLRLADGATLKVLANATLPPLVLDATSAVIVGDNETKPAVSATLDGAPTTAFARRGDEMFLSRFVVASNATVKFSRDVKLKNMDATIFGTVTTTSNGVGGVTFGHAARGETSYFSFLADGATIYPLTKENVDCAGHYVWPAEGGRVVQVRPYRFGPCNFPSRDWADYANIRIGVNNPVDEPCEFVFDGTTFKYSYHLYVGGASTVRCINGASIIQGNGGHFTRVPSYLEGRSCVELDGPGTELSAFGEGTKFSFMPDEAGFKSVVLKNGGAIKGFHLEGNGKAVLSVHEGEWTVLKRFSIGEPLPVLTGFASAEIEEGGVFSIVGRDEGHSNTGSWSTWDRDIVVASPITGVGDVVVSNAVANNSMSITVTNGANTCTGTISCNGINNCNLFFADGANWAGTVVAGDVALTNVADGATAATASFGTLRLAKDFPLRVWMANDAIATNDMLVVDTYVNGGGRLLPTVVGEGRAFATRDIFVAGRIGKRSPLPRVPAGWGVRRRAIAGDDAYDKLVVTCGNGFSVSLR